MSVALGAMQPQRRAHDLAHALAGVERREGVLEDHLHLPPQRLHLPARRFGDVVAAEADAPSVASIRRISARDSVVLPQPDSPTSPSV